MGREALERLLTDSLKDAALDKAEQRALREEIEQHCSGEEDANWVRNRAFDLVSEHVTDDNYRSMLRWLERVLKIARPRPVSAAPARVAMSPGEACRALINAALDRCRRSADLCVFTITDNDIVAHILAAHERGVFVRVITDNDKSEDRGSDVQHLIDSGVPVCTDTSSAHMHHKFAIFDGQSVLTGSYNWTRSASSQNQENLVLLEEAPVTRAFQAEFDRLWTRWS